MSLGDAGTCLATASLELAQPALAASIFAMIPAQLKLHELETRHGGLGGRRGAPVGIRGSFAVTVVMLLLVLLLPAVANAEAGLVLSVDSVVVYEPGHTGGSTQAVFSIALREEPTSTVAIQIAYSDEDECTAVPNYLTWSTSDWSSAQSVVVTALEDHIAEIDVETVVLTMTAVAVDDNYSGLQDSIDVSIHNVDVEGVTLDAFEVDTQPEPGAGYDMDEGVSGTYSIVLDTKPESEVTISMVSNSALASPSPAQLVFVPSDDFNVVNRWYAPQVVTITAVNDDIDRGDSSTVVISHHINSPDSIYAAYSPDELSISIGDDDTAGVSVSEAALGGALELVEGVMDTSYTIALTSQPISDVTVNLSHDAEDDLTLMVSTLVFTADNWSSAQPVEMQPTADHVDETDIENFVVSAVVSSPGDSRYDAIGSLPDVSVAVSDIDVAGVSATVATSSALSEATTDSVEVSVVLDSMPTEEVTVTLSAPPSLSLSTATLVFDAETWNVAAVITATAVDDQIDFGETFTVGITAATASDDPFYVLPETLEAEVDISDNDVAHVSFDTQSVALHECGSASLLRYDCVKNSQHAVISVTFQTQPIDDTLVTMSGFVPELDSLSVSPTQLVFSPASWNTATFTLTANDDDLDLGSSAFYDFLARFTISAEHDPQYDSLEDIVVDVDVSDDDTAAVLTGDEAISISEDFANSQLYTIVLRTQPTHNVVVDISSDHVVKVTSSPAAVTFTPSNWNTPQLVFPVAASPQVNAASFNSTWVLFSHKATSEDPNYSNIDGFTLRALYVESGVKLDMREAPKMISARLSPVSDELFVEFDVDTDSGGQGIGIASTVECATEETRLFNPLTVSVLGPGAECYWQSRRRLVVIMTATAGTSVGLDLQVAGGRIRRFRDDNLGEPFYSTAGSQSVADRIPPPTLVSAKIMDTGAGVALTFSGTKSPGIVGNKRGWQRCNRVFNDSDTLLGRAALCGWTGSYKLEARYGVDPQIEADLSPTDGQCEQGTSLSLLPGGLTVVIDGILSSSGCVPVVAAERAADPTAFLLPSAQSIGTCDDLVLDATTSGPSGGRPLSFLWSMTASSTSDLHGRILEQLARESADGSATITIAAEDLEVDTTFEFFVEVSNQMSSATSQASVQVVKHNDRLPVLQVAGGAQVVNVRRGDVREIIADADPPTCGGEDIGKRVSFTWENTAVSVPDEYAANEPDLIDMSQPMYTAGNPFTALIVGSTLSVGATYTIQVTATVGNEGATVNNSATFEVYVESASVEAVIDGGDARLASVEQSFTLDASSSVDHDFADDLEWSFTWECSEEDNTGEQVDDAHNGTCTVGDSGETLDPGQFVDPSAEIPGSRLTFPAHTFRAGGSYSFTVTASKGSGDRLPNHERSHSTSTRVDMVSGNTIPVTISAPRIRWNPAEELRLGASASHQHPVTWQWSQVRGALSWPEYGQPVASSVLTSPPTLPVIKIRAGELVPGAEYRFKAQATSVDGAIGFAELTVAVNTVPTSGFLTVSPLSSTVGERLTFTADRWLDDADDLPLSFQFAFTRGHVAAASIGERRLLSPSTIPRLSSADYVPYGVGVDGRMSAAVYVYDRFGAEARGSHDIDGNPAYFSVLNRVPSTDDERSAMLDSETDRLAGAVEKGSPEDVLGVVSMLAMLFNDPCIGVDCKNGDCHLGQCICHEGWFGLLCDEIEPSDGVYGDWGEWSSCSTTCGLIGNLGIRSRSRACLNVRGDGKTCEEQRLGPNIDTVPCNRNTCLEVIHGGWSEWAEGPCDSSCPVDRGGNFTGRRLITRTCSRPVPSGSGRPCPGISSYYKPCNEEPCPWPIKDCPGVTRDESWGLISECSGHGECVRSVEGCLANEDCDALCLCDEGFGGAPCELPANQWDKFTSLRDSMISAGAEAATRMKLGKAAINQQSSSLQLSTQSTDMLTEDSMNEAVDLVSSLGIAGVTNGLAGNAATNMVKVLSNIVTAVNEQLQLSAARQRRRRRRLIGQHAATGRKQHLRLLEALDRELDSQRRLDEAKAEAQIDEVGTVASTVLDGLVTGRELGEEAAVAESAQLGLSAARQDPSNGLAPMAMPGGGQVEFPAELASSLASQVDSDGLDMRTVNWVRDPGVPASNRGNVISGITDITLTTHSGPEIAVAELREPISFTIPLRRVLADRILGNVSDTDEDVVGAAIVPLCSYLDTERNIWTSRGVAVLGIDEDENGVPVLRCGSRHLTSFSATSSLQSAVVYAPDPVGDIGLLDQAFSADNLASTMVVITMLVLLLACWCAFNAKEEARRDEYTLIARLKFLKRGNLEPDADPRAGLAKLRATSKHLIAAQALGVFESNRRAHERETKEDETSNGVRTVDATQKSGPKPLTQRCCEFVMYYLHQATRFHKWVSTVNPPVQDRLLFTRPQRVATLAAGNLVSMAVVALFIGKDKGDLAQMFLVSVIASLCMLPSDVMFPAFFELVNSMKSSSSGYKAALARAKRRKLLEAAAAAKNHKLHPEIYNEDGSVRLGQRAVTVEADATVDSSSAASRHRPATVVPVKPSAAGHPVIRTTTSSSGDSQAIDANTAMAKILQEAGGAAALDSDEDSAASDDDDDEILVAAGARFRESLWDEEDTRVVVTSIWNLLVMGVLPNLTFVVMSLATLLLAVTSLISPFGGLQTTFFAVTGGLALVWSIVGTGVGYAMWTRTSFGMCMVGLILFGTAMMLYYQWLDTPGSVVYDAASKSFDEEWGNFYNSGDISILVDIQDSHSCCGFSQPMDRFANSSAHCALLNATTPDSALPVSCSGFLPGDVAEDVAILFAIVWSVGAMVLGGMMTALCVAARRPGTPRVKPVLKVKRGTPEWEDMDVAATIIQRLFLGVTARTATLRLREINRWESKVHIRRLLIMVVYALLGFYMLFFLYINVLFGVAFNTELTQQWLRSTFIAYLIDFFVSEAVIVLLISVLLKSKSTAAKRARLAIEQVRVRIDPTRAKEMAVPTEELRKELEMRHNGRERGAQIPPDQTGSRRAWQ